MEFENENMYCIDYTEEVAYQPEKLNDFSVHSDHVEEQIQESYDKVSAQSINQTNETREENVELQEPLYKLNNVDTESSVKTEIKQSILTRVADETSSRVLNDTWFETEYRIENLRTQTDQLLNKNQALEKEIDADELRLTQSEETLKKINEMIILLKEDLDKSDLRQQESSVNIHFKKSFEQIEKLKTLKEIYISKLKNIKEIIHTVETRIDEKNEKLKLELSYKKNVLGNVKKKQIELDQVVSLCINEIQYNMVRNDVLVQKLTSVNDNIINAKNEFLKLADGIECINKKKENQINRLNDLNEIKAKLQQEIAEQVCALDQMRVITDNDKQTPQEEMRKNKFEHDLKTLKLDAQEIFQNLHQNYTNVDSQLSKALSAVRNCKTQNNDLLIEMKSLNSIFVQKNEEKATLTNETLNRQTFVHGVKMAVLQKKSENEKQRKNLEQLRKEVEASDVFLHSLEDSIRSEKENMDREIMHLKSKVFVEQSEINKCSSEMKNKKDYVLANFKFLEEKSNNLCKEVNQNETVVENLQNENSNFKILLEKKQFDLNTMKNSLIAKRTEKFSLASGFKMPNEINKTKKVKFNEIVSFKSISSDNSSTLMEDAA